MKKKNIKLSEKELITSLQSMDPIVNEELKTLLKMDLVANYAQPDTHFQPTGIELWMGKSILLILVISFIFVLAQLRWESMEDLVALVPLLFAGLVWGIFGLARNSLEIEH